MEQSILGTIYSVKRFQNTEAAVVSQMISEITKESLDIATVSAAVDTFIATYYNKYTSNDILYGTDYHPDDATKYVGEDFYIKVATHQLGVDSILINGNQYNTVNNYSISIPNGRYKEISIGKNARIQANVWKIVDGELYVAIPWLYANADPKTGYATVVINGFEYIVPLFEPITDDTKLTISSAEVTVKDSYLAKAEVKGNRIDAYYNHGTQAIGIIISAGTTELTDVTSVIFRLASTGNMGMTTPEEFRGKQYTYLLYASYKDEVVSVERTLIKNYTLLFPRYGAISFDIYAHEVIPIS